MKKLQSLLLAVLLVAGIFVGVTSTSEDLMAGVYWGVMDHYYINGEYIGSWCKIIEPASDCVIVVAN